MDNKFEQLIEYIINDEEEKARALFHDVVVEKSRNIYETLIAEELPSDETVEENIETNAPIGGDQVDEFIRDVTADEEGIALEDDAVEVADDADDLNDDGVVDNHEENHVELEDRVVDLEDKLDELMAEFEAMMDNPEDTAPVGDDLPAEEMPESTEVAIDVTEAVTLTPVKADLADHSDDTKSPTPANSGAKGAVAKAALSSGEEKGSPAPKAEDQGGTTSPEQTKVTV
ncbi:MAG: hypothetical protein H0Z55_00550 [Nitrosarchaeum sp.]|jgi:hypothetical protein|nr:hypothetical protein [Nitrosarchaeum sp.]